MRFLRQLLVLVGLSSLVAPTAHAGPALLFDLAESKVLYAEDIDHQWHPASLTKMMTAYLTFEALKQGRIKLDQQITCSEKAFNLPPSKVGLPIGGAMSVDLALQALIVKSANDVALMLAEAVGGSEDAFVAQMNATAKKLGMTRTQFVNPNGLPAAEQVTTARDLAKLARAIARDYPEHAHYWSQPVVQLGKLKLRSHNGLLRKFEGADGMKTGFICDSGFNVVASATREGNRLVAVVLGEQSGEARTVRAAGLLEHGFQNMGWKQLFNGQTIDNVPMAADAQASISVRDQVKSWDCGREKRIAVRKEKAKVKAAAAAEKRKANAAAKTAAAAPAAGQAAPAESKKKSKVTPAAAAPAVVPAAAPAAAIAAPAPATAVQPKKKPKPPVEAHALTPAGAAPAAGAAAPAVKPAVQMQTAEPAAAAAALPASVPDTVVKAPKPEPEGVPPPFAFGQ